MMFNFAITVLSLALFSTAIPHPDLVHAAEVTVTLSPLPEQSVYHLPQRRINHKHPLQLHQSHIQQEKRAVKTIWTTLPAPTWTYLRNKQPSSPTQVPAALAPTQVPAALSLTQVPVVSSPTQVPAAQPQPPTSVTINKGNNGNNNKAVFAHYMMGNAYPNGIPEFKAAINQAASVGIDGFALNVGPDSWMADRVALMYAAAIGTQFKLFISLDMAVMGGSRISDLTPWVTNFKSHPNQYFYNGKQFVSTFAGEGMTFGQGSVDAGWNSFKNTLAAQGVNIYFVPSFTAMGAQNVMSLSAVDGAFSWDAWPTSNAAMTTAQDTAYMNARNNGKTYMAGLSPGFFTHFSYKNWIYKSQDLFTTRWEQLVALQPDFIEIITWNDYGESSYIGPVAGATPYDGSGFNSAQWVNGFDHSAFAELSSYYIQAYKAGAYPTVAANKLFWWYRTHSKNAVASNDPYGQPTSAAFEDDNIFLTLLLTGPATVAVTSGGATQTFTGAAGVNHFQYVSFSEGTPSVKVTMNGMEVLNVAGGKSISNAIKIYNYNLAVFSSSF